MAQPPFNAYTANMPNEIGLDTAVFYIGSTPLGVTDGGQKFDPKKTFLNINFDGKRAPIAGLDRVTKFESEITAKFLQCDISAFLQYEAGSVSSSGSVGNVIMIQTIQSASQLIPLGSLLQNFRCIWKLGSTTGTAPFIYRQVRFYRALVTKYTAAWKDNGSMEIDATFAARLDLTVSGLTTDSAPYIIEDLNSVP
jgi:hypothetical protein